MEGFTSKLSIVITKGSDWDEQKTCGVFIEDHEHRSILLGLFPLAEAFDFAECISTAFQIWQYDMTIDNKEIENNG
jgi:hypothetical protein